LLLLFNNLFVPPGINARHKINRMAPGGAKSDCQKGPIQSSELKNITVQCILEKSWLADAVEAGFAQAGLSRPAKAEPDGR
jgi:hypothetical protein